VQPRQISHQVAYGDFSGNTAPQLDIGRRNLPRPAFEAQRAKLPDVAAFAAAGTAGNAEEFPNTVRSAENRAGRERIRRPFDDLEVDDLEALLRSDDVRRIKVASPRMTTCEGVAFLEVRLPALDPQADRPMQPRDVPTSGEVGVPPA
jgi:hypothetical protein